MRIEQLKQDIAENLRQKIAAGEEIDGEVLPKDPIAIKVVGRSPGDLQARVTYRSEAPHYLDVSIA